jgi:hypothetical protein
VFDAPERYVNSWHTLMAANDCEKFDTFLFFAMNLFFTTVQQGVQD